LCLFPGTGTLIAKQEIIMATLGLSIKPYAHVKHAEIVVPSVSWFVRLKQAARLAGKKLQGLGRRLEKVSPWYEATEPGGRLVMFS
jgi:hypothetical protein